MLYRLETYSYILQFIKLIITFFFLFCGLILHFFVVVLFFVTDSVHKFWTAILQSHAFSVHMTNFGYIFF